MPDLDIRPADEADLSLLVHALGQEVFLTKRVRWQRRGHGILLVAWRDKEPVGFVYLWLTRAEERELRRELPGVPLLNRLHVTAAHRGVGIGTSLMREAERILAERGYRRVALGVGVDNLRARRLYERLGYRDWRLPPISGRVEADLGSGGLGRKREIFTILIKNLDPPPPA
jgi:ribosomal protein S18 acetylase RimI-like enzyme